LLLVLLVLLLMLLLQAPVSLLVLPAVVPSERGRNE